MSLGHLPSLKSLKLKRQRITGEDIEGCPSSSSSSSSSEHPQQEEKETLVIESRQWLRRYVNMSTFFHIIHNEATAYSQHHNVEIFSPIENMVALFLLASKSHDYIDLMNFAKGVGDKKIWETAMTHQKELAGLVKVGYGPDRVTGQRTKYITVNTAILREFLLLCYRTVANTRKNPEASYKKLVDDIPEPCITHMIAGQLAWTLHYWSLGSIRSARIEDGLCYLHDEKFSVYGFNEDGWSRHMLLSPQKTCPFFVTN